MKKSAKKTKSDKEIIEEEVRKIASYPEVEVKGKDFLDYQLTEKLMLEMVVEAATRLAFFKKKNGKGESETDAENITFIIDTIVPLLKYRQEQYKTPSIWANFFHMTKEGKAAVEVGEQTCAELLNLSSKNVLQNVRSH